MASIVKKALEALAERAAGGSEPALPEIENALDAFEHAVVGMDTLDEAPAHFGRTSGSLWHACRCDQTAFFGIPEYRAGRTSQSQAANP